MCVIFNQNCVNFKIFFIIHELMLMHRTIFGLFWRNFWFKKIKIWGSLARVSFFRVKSGGRRGHSKFLIPPNSFRPLTIYGISDFSWATQENTYLIIIIVVVVVVVVNIIAKYHIALATTPPSPTFHYTFIRGIIISLSLSHSHYF